MSDEIKSFDELFTILNEVGEKRVYTKIDIVIESYGSVGVDKNLTGVEIGEYKITHRLKDFSFSGNTINGEFWVKGVIL